MKQFQTPNSLYKSVLVFAAAAVLFACKKTDTPPAPKPPVISYNQKIVSVNVGEAIPNLVPDSSKGGSVTQYSVYPGLPKGISLNQTNGVISGTPTDSLNPTRFIITAYGPAGMGHDTITISVGTVGFVYGTTGSYTFTIGAKDLSTTPLAPTVLAGTFKKFFIDPNLSPNDLYTTTGLSFDEATGKISGTPNKLTSKAEVSQALTFVITAVTNDNKVAYDTIHITINDMTPVVNYAFRGSFSVGVSVGTLLTPAVTLTPGILPGSNFGVVAKYRLAPNSPALPDSLVLDSLTGKITGTPKADGVGTPTVVIRAINSGGYLDISLPLDVEATAVAPEIKYMMSYLSNDTVDIIAPAILSGNTIYLTKKDTAHASNLAGVPTIYLNPVIVAGQPGSFSLTPTGSPLTLTTSTGMFSGTPAVAATTPYAGTLNINNLQAGAPAGSFAVNMVSNVQFFTYNSGGVGGLLGNYYQFLKNQKVDQGTGGVYPGYTTAGLTPVTNGNVTKFAIYPMTATAPAFAATGLSFSTTTGAISGTPTMDSQGSSSITATWPYLIVGTAADGSFTIFKINVKIYQTDAGWGGL